MVKVEAALGVKPDPVRRLGALGVWVAEDAERLTQRLRLSNAESERLTGAGTAGGALRRRPVSRPRARSFIISGRNRSPTACSVAWARSEAGVADRAWRELASLPQRWTAPAFPLKAADFARRGDSPRAGSRRRIARRGSRVDRGGFSGRPRGAAIAIADKRCEVEDILARRERSRRSATGASLSRGRTSAIMPRGRMRSTCISLPRQTKSSPRIALMKSTGKSRSRARQQSG